LHKNQDTNQITYSK